MKKAVAFGMTVLTMAIMVMPMKAEAAGLKNCYKNGKGAIIIAGSNCDFGLPGQAQKPQLPQLPEIPQLPQLPQLPELPQQPQLPQLPEIEDNTGNGDMENDNTGNGGIENENNVSYVRRVVELVNKERAKEGLTKLALDTKLEKAANIRAEEIQTSFSHTRPNGSSFSTVLKENGISYRGSGENIAWGQLSPEEVVKGWMNSPSHRANIMNSKFTKIGVGHMQNSAGRNYWVQLFTY